ncbi:MAG: hypothetical protein JSS87_15275 [Acidobacteria bacterium]|nr:hypothetical protein [Acidobacteriota bacterium]
MTRFPAAAAVLLTLPLAAQHTPPKPTHIASADVDKALPLRRVSLYKNGVGYFEHIGPVSGSPRVTITFTTAQLNDVLQTLTAVDLGGGHITGAGYNSTTPLEQQLKNLPISLSADPTAADFYSAIRGARVEVTGSGAPITGRILNVELRNVTSPKKDEDSSSPVQKHFLTVISDAGAVRSLELTGNTSVRLLDPVMQDGVKRYLQVLNSTRSDGLRQLTLTDSGSGTREMRVSYVSEVPVWKSTYRILFDEKPKKDGDVETATLQGWAVIDNTVGTDWENVHLSLIAGAPQSFIQPISQPYYSRRAEIPLPEEAQLTPQTHESGEPNLGIPAPMVAASPYISGSAGGVAGGIGQGMGSGSNVGGGVYSAQELAKLPRRMAAPIAYEDSASASIAPATKTSSFDDYFEYKLTDPITIRRNESALVPILQTKIPAERVTLWSESQPAPLRALWITNTSDLTLDRGSFSIVENGNFGGQGLLDPIHPKEKRLLSYAADQAVHVSNDGYPRTTRRIQQIALSKGVLTEKTVEIVERSYLVHNAASEARTVIVEHNRHRGWDLDSDPKPVETTDGVYRFRVVTAPGASVRLHVGERHTLSAHYRIAQMDERQIDLMLRTAGNTNTATEQALREKLAPVIEARHRLADIDSQIGNRNAEINRISDDQKRVRENLSSLKSSAEERDLIRRYTKQLNEQEDRLVVLRKEIESLQQQRTAAQADLDRVVEGLQFEQEV